MGGDSYNNFIRSGCRDQCLTKGKVTILDEIELDVLIDRERDQADL